MERSLLHAIIECSHLQRAYEGFPEDVEAAAAKAWQLRTEAESLPPCPVQLTPWSPTPAGNP